MFRHSGTVEAYAARTLFSELLERVEDGEEVTITRHGSPVARLVPIRRRTTPEQRRAAIEAMRKLAKGLRLRGLRVKDLIREGRRSARKVTTAPNPRAVTGRGVRPFMPAGRPDRQSRYRTGQS
jgi:prevent-host-death family protein